MVIKDIIEEIKYYYTLTKSLNPDDVKIGYDAISILNKQLLDYVNDDDL